MIHGFFFLDFWEKIGYNKIKEIGDIVMQFMTDTVLKYKINEALHYATVIGFAKNGDKRKTIKIPNKIGEYEVQEIGAFAFYKNKYLESVRLPDCLSIIGESAFSACEKLETVYIYPSSQSQVIIDTMAFACCPSLKEFSGEETMLYNCASYIFSDCPNLAKVIGRFSNLGAGAFFNCKKIKTITLGHLAKWTATSFRGCSNLETLSVFGNLNPNLSETCINWLRKMHIQCPHNSTLVEWVYDGVNINII